MSEKKDTRLENIQKLRSSLKTKSFRTIIILSVTISIVAICLGVSLYMSSVRRSYRSNTYNMSLTASRLIDRDEVMREASEVIKIYKSLSEEERQLLIDKHSDLLKRFDGIRGEGSDRICELLRLIQDTYGGKAAFTAFLDLENNRRVFITDSDPNDSFCPPGSLDELEKISIDDLMNGRQYLLDDMYGIPALPATTINMSPYGYRCMAGTLLGTIDGYPVFIFFDTDMNKAVNAGIAFMWVFFFVMLILILLTQKISLKYVDNTMVAPIKKLTDAAEQYINERGNPDTKGGYFNEVDINTGDEIEQLSKTMQVMESDLDKYISNLTTITAERERLSTELSLANKIQADMLPNIYPAFPDRDEFDIYALMDPATMVGGDFYDFFLIDDDHLGLLIADVSGKGIPAALFMMICLIVLKNSTMLSKSISKALATTNEAICTNNTNEMFVTVWMGILEISTGKLTAANAGHEYPTIRRKDGKFEIFKDRHGFVIGSMRHMKYEEYEIQMEPGDKIFVYTDGVPEANNSEKEMFGTQRLLEALNIDPDASPEQTIMNVRKAIDEFDHNEEQFDDLTMLCMEYRGKKQ